MNLARTRAAISPWRNRFIISLLGAALAFALFHWQQARETSRATIALTRDHMAWAQRVKQAETLVRARETDVALAPENPANGLVPPDTPSSFPLGAGPVAALRLNATKAGIKGALGKLFSELGLSSAKIDAIVTSLALHEARWSDLRNQVPAASRNNPSDPVALSIKAKMDDENRQHRIEFAALLGQEAFQRYERFKQETPYHERVSELATYLYDTDSPLTQAQADQLAKILIANATSTDGRILRSVVDWGTVKESAAALLSPPQLELLEAAHESRELRQQLNRMRADAARAK